jgi:hypothetical protein
VNLFSRGLNNFLYNWAASAYISWVNPPRRPKMSRRQDIAEAVAQALRDMRVEDVTVDRSRRHPRVLWRDMGGSIQGILTVPGTASDHRSLLNNVRMAQRLVRQARENNR